MTNILKGIFKLSLALGLIYWLIQSGKLDFKLLQEAFNSPLSIILAIFFMQFDHILVAYRLRLLIQIKAVEKISFIKLFLANWIGIFFNSVLPGSVTGDIVKIFYIKELDKNLTKKYLLMSVFIDRVIGLLGLITISGIFSLINYKSLTILSSEVKLLIHINLFLFLMVIVTILFIFFFKDIPLLIAKPFENLNVVGKIFKKLKEIWIDICQFKHIILKVLGLSITIQAIAIFIFWFLTHPYAQGNFTLSTAFTVMPIGFISLAIPIAPAGLGVGHVVFEKLLGYFAITNGASLFNIYFFVVMISNLTGVIPYITHSSKGNIHLKDIEKMEDELD
jgi:uncharacterized membrane protein YbhN (UPF0104 family)